MIIFSIIITVAPQTNLWSWCPGGSVHVAPWWSEVRKEYVQAGPLVSAPAGILRWLLGPPQDRRREPLRSRPLGLRSAWSRLCKTSDRHRAEQQRSESIETVAFIRSFTLLVCCMMQTERKQSLMDGIYLTWIVDWGVVIIWLKRDCHFNQSITALMCTCVVRCMKNLIFGCTHLSILNKLWGIYKSSSIYIFFLSAEIALIIWLFFSIWGTVKISIMVCYHHSHAAVDCMWLFASDEPDVMCLLVWLANLCKSLWLQQ